MIPWMFHSLLISSLLVAAALAAERALRLYRRPVRWIWLAALTLALALPLIGLMAPTRGAAIGLPPWSIPGISTGLALSRPSPAGAEASRWLPALEDVLLITWVLTSLILGVYFTMGYVRLRRTRVRWSRSRVNEVEVLVSRDLGPAVTGFRRGAILLPSWVLELDSERRRLIVAHETEHLRAGDHRVLLLALAACVLVPWNLPLWWGLRRLRLALELDCDRRVLQRGADLHEYAALLVEVGRRARGPRLAPTAFAERVLPLERRVRELLGHSPCYRGWRALISAAAAVLLVAAAGGAPRPDSTGPRSLGQGVTGKLTGVVRDAASGEPLAGTEVKLVGEDVGAVTGDNGRYFIIDAPAGPHVVAAEKAGYAPARLHVTVRPDTINTLHFELQRTGPVPLFTPFTQAPQLRDVAQARAALERHYPDSLRASGVGGLVVVWLFVGADGQIRETRVSESSGVEALDRAAEAAAREFELTPARNRGEPVAVWIKMPLTFQPPRSPEEEARGELRGALRMVATTQEEHYTETGGYYPTLADTLRSFIPAGAEVLRYDAGPEGWALVLRRGEHECAMYYGRITAPTDYAKAGRAVCRE